MAYQPSVGANDAFQSGVNHLTASGRANNQSITLADQGLDATSARWNSLTPHGVIQAALGSSPADTDTGIEMGQSALGPGMNHGDQADAQTGWDRAVMQRSAQLGSDDGIA